MILEDLIYNNDYKCYDVLKEIYMKNNIFRQIINYGYYEGKIFGFKEDIWNKIRNQNIRAINSFEDVFKEGANIGYCTVTAKQLSYSFANCYICGGDLPVLRGTNNSPSGEHTWLEVDNYIIDTTLMLFIDKSYASKIGYIEMNRHNPNRNSIYLATKDFTLDSNIKKK